jgi:hypothetical protein
VPLRAVLWIVLIAGPLHAQQDQQASSPGWPCVAGRAIDPSYLNISESTGGQLFLFQKNEVAQAGDVMSASYTHPATVLRLVGNLNGATDLEFPVDRSIRSLLVLASVQCRKQIQVLRPSGSELNAGNSPKSVDLAAGRILRVDEPEAGKWKVRLNGTGLFVLSVLASSDIRLTSATVSETGIQFHVTGEASHVAVRLVDAAGGRLSDPVTPELAAEGVYRNRIELQSGRFRILVTGDDADAWPFQRMYPVLFSTPLSGSTSKSSGSAR